MLADINLGYSELFNNALHELPFMLYVLAGLWAFNIIHWVLHSPFNILGIYPRSLWGLMGIVFSPFIHGNFNHLFFNTIPFFVLGMFILAMGQNLFIGVTVVIAIVEGLLVWAFARKCLHIGMSGIISGYFGFLLGLAYFNPTLVSVVLAIVTLYYFGSIIAGVLPTSDKISFECHLAGMVTGIGLVYVLWNYPQYENLLLRLF